MTCLGFYTQLHYPLVTEKGVLVELPGQSLPRGSGIAGGSCGGGCVPALCGTLQDPSLRAPLHNLVISYCGSSRRPFVLGSTRLEFLAVESSSSLPLHRDRTDVQTSARGCMVSVGVSGACLLTSHAHSTDTAGCILQDFLPSIYLFIYFF